jgi:hypothetical protein
MLVGTIEPKETLTGYLSSLDMSNTIELYQSEQETYSLSVKDQNGNPENLTGGTLVFTVKRDLDDTDPLIVKTSAIHRAYISLDDNGGSPQPALLIEAKEDGLSGNDLTITTALANKFSTTLNNGGTLDNGAVSATLTDATGVVIGSALKVTDGPVSTTLIVTSVTGNVITFVAISGLASPIADASPVVEQSFTLVVKNLGSTVETHNYISMEPTNVTDYVELRLAADSDYIQATDLESTNPAPDNRPEVVTNAALTGGAIPSGGITITDALSGSAELQLLESDTQTLKPRTYYYDIKYIRGNSSTAQYVVPRSAFVIKQPVG